MMENLFCHFFDRLRGIIYTHNLVRLLLHGCTQQIPACDNYGSNGWTVHPCRGKHLHKEVRTYIRERNVSKITRCLSFFFVSCTFTKSLRKLKSPSFLFDRINHQQFKKLSCRPSWGLSVPSLITWIWSWELKKELSVTGCPLCTWSHTN